MKERENSGSTETTGQLPNLQENDPLTSFYAYCAAKEEAVIFERIMAQFAKERGANFLRENERLKNTPEAAVPEDMSRRMVETINTAFDKKQHG